MDQQHSTVQHTRALRHSEWCKLIRHVAANPAEVMDGGVFYSILSRNHPGGGGRNHYMYLKYLIRSNVSVYEYPQDFQSFTNKYIKQTVGVLSVI